MTDVKTKKSPKPKKDGLKTARKILVADLQVGMRIVTKWHKNLKLSDYMPEGLDEFEQLEWLYTAEEYDYVAASTKVTKLELCTINWRTHLHVNSSDCYDERRPVYVVNE
jgi:hypothetical protein